MNLKNRLASLAGALLVVAILPAAFVRASFPSLALSTNGSAVQAIVSNGDPNSQVTFYYPTGSVVIGTTDGSGYLTANITPGSYNLSLGNPVYVVINGTHSPTATWPSVSSGSSSGTAIYISQPAVTVNIGQSASVSISNANNDISIPSNSNPSAVTASVSGSYVNINGLAAGTAVLTVCSSSAGCGTINATVQPNGVMSPPIYLNPSSATININQVQTVAITGYASGPYYVSSNSNGSAVSAAISGSSLMLTGLSSGASNITVCATGGQCGTMYATVSGTSNGSSNLPLSLQSVTLSSNGANSGFASAGNVVTLSFMANQSIVNPQLRVNGQNILVTGSGNGPYIASYTVSGSQSSIPVTVSFANSSGTTASASFTIGAASSVPVSANTTTVTCPAGYTCTSNSSAPTQTASTPSASSGSYAFNRYLYMGMNKMGESDPDVVALQKRLKADGLFSGASTGYFGAETKAAVVAYQKKHGLSQLGVVGPATRTLLSQGI